jgi:hypothetical protein
MRITHLANSFLRIETPDATLVCDPWVGVANHGGWRSFPDYDPASLIAFVADADFVYISHIHSDHFDPRFLVDSGLIHKSIVIKRFETPTLKRRLEGLGATAILELEPWTRTRLADRLEVAIIPALQVSNSASLGGIDYDLDTSLVVSDGAATFFNQVDTPMSLDHFRQVKDFISDQFGPLEAAAAVCGAASEYPQCFLNIDREGRQQVIIDRSLERLKASLAVLDPKVAFLAGGTYLIPGRNAHLNRMIAQPSFAQAAAALDGQTPLLDLEGGWAITLSADGAEIEPERALSPLAASMAAAIERHARDLYPHEAEPLPDQGQVIQRFERAQAAYLARLAQQDLDLNACIDFRLYSELTEARARAGDRDLDLHLGPRSQFDAAEHHVIHIDIRAFDNCLTRRQSWNQTLSGSLCLFERTPDVHTPDVLFSLNHLVAPT